LKLSRPAVKVEADTPQLINNAKLAVLFTETLQKKFAQSPLPYVEGTNPSEVKSWKEFVPSSATQ
jgi:carbamoyl-phosphate synthase large subunit